MFGGNFDTHVDMISHQVPLYNPAFLLTGQLMKNLPQVLANLTKDDFFTAFRDKNDMVLAIPLRV